MRTTTFICIVLLVLGVHNEALQIFTVSSSPTSVVYPVGSVRGGTTIYITGLGFSSNKGDNQVYIGKYPCNIPANGATDTTLACVTSDTEQLNDIYNLPITVTSNKQKQSFNDGQGIFSYLSSQTPVITRLYPASGTADTEVNIEGSPKISDFGDGQLETGEIKSIKIGDNRCNRFNIAENQKFINNGQTISCQQASIQQSDKYEVEHQMSKGDSTPDYHLKRSSLEQQDDDFHFVVLPAVKSFTPTSGSVAGTWLNITGSGFSTNAKKLKVTVDATNCDVSSSTITSIRCKLRQKNASATARIETGLNSTNQTNGYFSGAGLNYKRYDVSSLQDRSPAGLREAIASNSSSIRLSQTGYRAQILTGEYYGYYYGQSFTGYFTATVTGNHTFRGVAVNTFALYLSTSYGTTGEPAANPLIYSNTDQSMNNFYTPYVPTAESTVSLQKGKSYYMEVYHLNLWGAGFLKVSVVVPNNNTKLQWQTHAVHQLDLNYTNQPQIIDFSQTGGTKGNINLTITTKNGNSAPRVVWAVVPYNATINQFINALNQLYVFWPYRLSGVLTMYAYNNSETTNSSAAYRYNWRISIYLMRNQADVKAVIVPKYLNYTGNKNFTMTTVQVHGPLISGNFLLSIGGVSIKAQGQKYMLYNMNAAGMQESFNDIRGLQHVEVALLSDPSLNQYQSSWLISYYGYNNPVPHLVFSNANLSGGVAGTKPKIFFKEVRAYSSDLLFDPIDYQFLSTPSSGPSVLVTVNQLPSVCTAQQGNCIYTFVTVPPILTKATLSGSILSLALTDPSNISYSLNDVSITFGNQPCVVINATNSTIGNFQCRLTINNSDSTPTIEAGSYIPTVTVRQVGLVKVAQQITPLNFPLTLTSLNISSGGTNGGYGLLLTGTGFPLNVSNAQITICNQKALIESINNIQCAIIVPKCSNFSTQSITISNGKNSSNSLTFTYNSLPPLAVIYTVSPQSANPSQKGTMIITGYGFGADSTKVNVYLANASGIAYQMRVLKINDTSIKVGTPGGLPGLFTVEVNVNGVGMAQANSTSCNSFNYQLTITSITPKNGSYNGGTLIHLQGINFAAAMDETLVFVGNALNWFCNFVSLNTTDIFCRTPPINLYYNISQSQTVVLTNKLMVDNTCAANQSCTFNYIPLDSSPNLTNISVNSIASGSVTLTGTNLNLSPPVVVLTNTLTGVVTVTNATSSNGSSVTFLVPSVESGPYKVVVRSDPIGQSNELFLNITTAGSAATPTSFSVNGGNVVLSGTGLPAVWPNSNFALKIYCNNVLVEPQVISTNPSALTLALPASTSGSSFVILLSSDVATYISYSVSSSSASTPLLTMTNSSSTSPGTINFKFAQNNLQTTGPTSVSVYSLYNPSEAYTINGTNYATGLVQFTATLTGGLYGFKFFYQSYGWATSTSSIAIKIVSPTAPAIATSYNGGVLALTGAGLSRSATVAINGVKTRVQNVTASGAVAVIPPFVTVLSQQNYSLATAQTLTQSHFSIISDTAANQALAFDGVLGSAYVSSSAGTCYLGIDVGNETVLNPNRIRFFPYSQWVIASQYLTGARFEASNDGNNWTTIATISAVHSGWNILPISLTTSYQFYRFVHNTTSNCQLAELQFQGILLTDVSLLSLTSNLANVVYSDGANTFTLANKIQFRKVNTPVVTSLSQPNGDVFGGYSLTLYGIYLNIGTPSIVIDGISCVVTASNSTAVTCTVGSRFSLPSYSSFVVTIGTANAIIHQRFSYVMRWSDIRTWGTDMPPIDGDLVYVPPGMNLLVDQSTPILKGILVQNGTLTFSDQSDMVISTGFITLTGGSFIAGTESNPYQHQLTFVMYGNYYSPQQPLFGAKGIGCLECFISMYGKPRQYTWTVLSVTANIGDTNITVKDNVDWNVGEQIVIASTDFDHHQSEQRTIVSINGTTIFLNATLLYMHYSAIQTYGSDQIEMRAEVGLLTRNIKVMGESDSQASSYGSHLMMTGSSQNGLIGQIAYSQFTDCGQPFFPGRYCIHYHMVGDASDSYARGNAVHHSMARVITLHGVHYLTVEYNVGYYVSGHNFFIEDGIQTNNLIKYNLAISSLQAWNMLQTDITVASFWITHPGNHLMHNHAAGSDFYGFWYQIKSRPDGPSASKDICPIGSALGQTFNNTSHSNLRYGLRIFRLSPRTYPCTDLYVQNPINPWQNNPAVIGTFSDFTLFKNGVSGMLAQHTANLLFTGFKAAQNKRAGAQFVTVDFTLNITSLKDSVFIGQSISNNPSDVTGSKGVITPRSGNMRIDKIRFYNYPESTRSIETCHNCDRSLFATQTLQQIFISNISFTNVTGYKLFMNGAKRDILYDLDGSFTKTGYDGQQRASAAIVNNYPHLASNPACLPPSNSSQWDTTIACNSSVKVVRVTFDALSPWYYFSGVGLKVQVINSMTQTGNTTSYSSVVSQSSYSIPFITGNIYNLWWQTTNDFNHLSMSSSSTLTAQDLGIRFKIDYTSSRQEYEIRSVRPGQVSNLFKANYSFLESSCSNGQYYHDNSVGSRTLQLCASAKNRTQYFETIDVNALFCRYMCVVVPPPTPQYVKESFVRYWSNASQWPYGRMPLPGQNVTVHGNWTIIMDVDPAVCEFMTIDGTVLILDTQDRNIECNAIWIRLGSLSAGEAGSPFTNNLNIKLNGLRNDSGYVFDPSLEGNKIFVVTGTLALYGTSPSTVSTTLTASAFPGDTSLTVGSAAGWAMGDEIVIAPSFSSSRDYERVIITSLNANTIFFTPALNYTHYGAPSTTISNSYGTLDTRASVGHVSRNIKFISGTDSNWGYTIVVYSMWSGNTYIAGQATFSSVQFTLGGQQETQSATLVLQNNGDTTKGQTIITSSSFSYCRSYCIAANGQNNNLISSNIFYEARGFHLQISSVTLFTVSRNLMIGARFRQNGIARSVACIQLTGTDPISSVIQFDNNICQGSDISGYIFPFIPCNTTSPFSQNTVGSAEVGFLLTGDGAGGCLTFVGAKAYACAIGQIASPPNTNKLILQNFVMADNGRAVSLRFGLEGTDRTAYLNNSYIAMISRPNCAYCYDQKGIDCQGNHGIRLLVVTVNGQNYPSSFDSSFDGLCKQQAFDSKAYIQNVQFDYFKQYYNESALQRCGNNVIFRSHPGAPDLQGSTHLFNTSCTDCQFNAMAYFEQPLENEASWLGGCGNMVCTGKINFLIEDHTNTIFPQGGVLLPNNTKIGSNTSLCTNNSYFNGYYCTRNDFAVLQYESIASDYNTRTIWPVSLKYDGGNWTTYTNGFKEWQWQGGEPLNKRLGRFNSLVQLYQMYNMTFLSSPPEDMRLALQKRTPEGNNSDWIIVKLYYPYPNSIQIQVDGVNISPIPLLDNHGQQKLNTSICGNNIFYYYNYTIHFVITGDLNCLVRVVMTNSLQLTLHFSMNINDFFSRNGPTRLIDRMCALLHINDQSLVKIVGIYNGSANVTLNVMQPIVIQSSSTIAVSQAQSVAAAQAQAATINSMQADGSLPLQLGLGSVLVVSTQVVPITPATDSPQSRTVSNIEIIIIAVTSSIVGIILVVVSVLLILKKRSNNKVAVEELPAFSSGFIKGKQRAKIITAKGKQRSNIITFSNGKEDDSISENISEIVFERQN